MLAANHNLQLLLAHAVRLGPVAVILTRHHDVSPVPRRAEGSAYAITCDSSTMCFSSLRTASVTKAAPAL